MSRKKSFSPPPAPREPTRKEPAAADGKKRAKGKAGALRSGLDFILMLAGALVVALLIKAYVFDIYLIPSGSMETALHGRPDGGDRIFCSKLSYRFRQPDRWEVAVFEFPYHLLRQRDPHGYEAYRNQNFVKRVVGLPGESMAIARGDIWVRPDGDRNPHRRATKSDRVQRGMWLHVYDEDFSDVTLDELADSWKILGGVARLPKGGAFRLDAGDESVRLDYRPRTPTGERRQVMTELPGIPDRYMLEQPVQFRCQAMLPDGTVCNHISASMQRTQNVHARCPKCGWMMDETAAIFYHRRSGLTEVGRYAVAATNSFQGELTKARDIIYHFVPDLRVRARVVLESEETAFSLTLREDTRFVQGVFHGNGQVEIRVNGEASKIDARALSGIRPGRDHDVEFYMADGVARLFVDSEEALLELPVWGEDKRPASPRTLPRSSGVSVGVGGGIASLSKMSIDRDVFYYSGWEHEWGDKMEAMNSNGEVFVGRESFFPMGDHCTSSYDARSWGAVPLSLLRGPALLVWWPPERFAIIPKP